MTWYKSTRQKNRSRWFTSRKKKPRPSTRRLELEALEARTLLTVNPTAPVYSAVFADAVTSDNAFTASNGLRYWDIDAGADNYQYDFYERPTTQTYEVRTLSGGSQRFAAAEYFQALDIIQASSGYDNDFLYVSIEMAGRYKLLSDNTSVPEGIIHRYGFRIGKQNDGGGGLLVVANQPQVKNSPNNVFASLGTFIYRDADSDVGRTGLNVTKQDLSSEVNGNGYGTVMASDGKLSSGQQVLWVRISPSNMNVVEFALDYKAFGYTAAQLATLPYFTAEANKGTKDPANYLWNDEYSKSEAGSPYRATSGDLSKSEFGTQGLGNIYELDTLEMRPRSSLAGYVYDDANDDSIKQAEELGLSGVTVTLTGTNDRGASVNLTTTTDSSGAYSFTGLLPSNAAGYTLTETQPAGYLDGKDTIGTPGGTTGNDVFSNIVLAHAVNGVDNNFGELSAASGWSAITSSFNNSSIPAGSTLWFSSIFRPSGIGIEPVTFYFTNQTISFTANGSNVTLNVPDSIVTLDPDALMVWTNFNPAKNAWVTTIPSNFSNNALLGGVAMPVTTSLPGSITPVKWQGRFTSDSAGTSLTWQWGAADYTSFTTSYNALYVNPVEDNQLSPYKNSDPAGTPEAFKTFVRNGGTGNGGTNYTGNYSQAASVPSVPKIPSEIAGYVYNDSDDDGDFDIGEQGISGVVITLTGTDDLGAAVYLSTTTDGEGAYRFKNLRAGTYTITEPQPSAYLDGQDTIGTRGGITSNDVFSNVVLGTGANSQYNNFGELSKFMVDLTTAGSSGTVNRAIFTQSDPQPTGSGVIQSFVRLQTNNLVSEGYNTDYRPVQFDENNSGTFTRALTLGEIGVKVVNGITYRQFMLDVNQSSVSPLLSLDQFRIYVSDSPNLTGYNTTTKQLAGLNPLYDLDRAGDGYVTLNYSLGSGSGSGDMFVLIPDSLFAGETVNTYVYLYSHFGGAFTNTAGYEEWATLTPSTPVAPPPLPTIAGYVYADLDNDSSKDGGESGISGVTVTLTGTDDLGASVYRTATTNSYGAYWFTLVRPSDEAGYTLTETQPTSYLDGKDTIGTPGGITGNDVFSSIVLPAGFDGKNNNFGELPPASLAGYVYSDLNNDGIKQFTETGIWFATVKLTGTDDLGAAINQTVLANSSGAYTFTDLRPGTYQIAETQPGAYLDGKDTIGTPGGTTANDVFSNIVLNAGVNGVNNNFGELPPSSLAGYVYADLNNDGFKQAWETGIWFATVKLTGTDDLGAAVSQTVLADSGGAYAFTNLRPGTYQIAETQPGAYLDGKDTMGTPGGTTANDVFSNIVLNAGVNGVNNNFGELPPASLAGYVYADVNNDGIKQVGELGISGATVTLTGTDDRGDAVNTATTSTSAGAYAFTGLRPGVYKLTESQPAAYLDGKDTVGTPGGAAGNDLIVYIVLYAGVNGADNNFGELPPSTMAGIVYADANNDGIKQASESVISGATVRLSGSSDRGLVSIFTTTDASGAYLFSDLRPGTYKINETQPAGYLDGKDTIGTPGGFVGNDYFSNIVLPTGFDGVNNNFGELPPASLAGFVYEDLNNDGIKQASEAGLVNVWVTLMGTNDLGTYVAVSKLTDSSGAYTFSNLRPGTYMLKGSQNWNYLDGKDTIGTQGGDATVNDVFSNIVLNAGIAGANNNFGELPPSSLAGFVYKDLDNDGIKQGTEPALISVLVSLTGTDDLGGAVNKTFYTNNLGAYAFTKLRPGIYTLTETQPAAYLDGKDTIGTQGGDATVNDVFSNIVLNAGVLGVDNNFGELLPSSLAGFVYADVNNDGIRQSAEKGLSDATVTLTGTTDVGTSVNLTATTDSTGAYAFADLRPGDYILTETQPANYFDGLDTIGTPGGIAGNDVFSSIVLGPDVAGTNNNFGELPPSSLAGYVYVDANDNGWYGWNEMGINGVSVTLTGTDLQGNPVNLTTTTSTLTDAATGLPTRGAYVFDNLGPGTYVITETQPAAFLDGKDTIGTPGGTVGNDVFSNVVLGIGFNGKSNNFGELQPANSFSSLAGSVYKDTNDDGIRQAGEDGIGSVLVTLTGTDALGNVVLRSFTNGNGDYNFPTLLPGTYALTETQPGAYPDGQEASSVAVGTVANDSISNIVIDTVTNLSDYNFGEMAPASLAGFVYEDLNNDGIKQDGESGIGGVTVYLTGTDDQGNAVNKVLTTTSSGSYIFLTLRPGTYTLQEVQPAAYYDGLDTIGTQGGTTGNDIFSNIVLSQNVSGQNNNFGELTEGNLAGYVYRDLNNDGTKQAGEAGISGVSVALTGTDNLGNAISQSTTTDTTGAYVFSNLQPGTYTLTETQPAGYIDGLDSVGTLGGIAGNDVLSSIVLLPNTSGFNYNFGERPPSSLAGRVFVDFNNNGSFDSSDLGLSGVLLTVTGTDDQGNTLNLATTTSASGYYSFINLQPGIYTLAETQPVSFLDGKDTLGTLGGTLGNDVFSSIVVPAGIAGVDYNFGELPPASLSGFVYVDSNDDGLQQTGESGISSVLVTLTGTDDLGAAVSHTTTTDSSGAYTFVTLRPGTYQLAETQPAGYVDGKDTIGTPGGTTGNDVFSNIQLTAGVQGANNNFGELVPAANASLSGFVYVDVNNDGTKQAGESGISGATLRLTGTNDLGAPVDLTTTTDVAGAYAFTGLRAGTYTLTEDQPAGYDDGLDSVGTQGGTASHNAVTNQDVFSIALASGVQGSANNFGELASSGSGSLSGYVYEDYNNNGLFETDPVNNEAGIYFATVTLTGTDDLGQAVALTTTTDLNGYYVFPNLRPGTYTLTETQPAGYLDGMDTLGTPGGDASVNDVFSNIVLVAGVDGVDNNFGELPPANLSGYVYLESDGQDNFNSASETGINGVIVTLTGKDDRGQDVILTTTTADVQNEFGDTIHGYYEFPNLRPSDANGYTITETQPSNYLQGPSWIGSQGGNDSAQDVFDFIVLQAGVVGTDNNFGELLPAGTASLAGVVYADTNNDGVQQAGELGIGNVLLTLTGTDSGGNAIMITTLTGADGTYSFANLPAGTYTLTESQPAGYLDGKDTVGSQGGTAGNDVFSNILLGAGVQGTDNNFGELLASSLSGYVYLDSDNDGLFDSGESALFAGTGVIIHLDGIDDLGNAVHLVTTADTNGFYIFVNLRPGTYSLHEEQPQGYFDGKDTPGSLGGAFAFTQDPDGSYHTDADLIYAIALNTAGLHGQNYNFGELDHAS